MSIYGSPTPDPEWERERKREVFIYLKALIEAEKKNPDFYDDEDNENMLSLLRKIALSETEQWQRHELIRILEQDEE